MYEDEGTTPGQAPSTGTPKVERRIVGKPADPAPDAMATSEQRPDPAWNKLLLVAWIDADGLLRREAPTSSMGALGSFTMTMDFSRYGSRPDIQVPQGPDVFDATPLMQEALDELDG